jgi:2-dehydro-3-deoxygalactonokinase
MIAVDWGTSSLRAYRIDADGAIRAQRRSEDGVLASRGRFAEVLSSALAEWDDEVVLLSGMVGGRSGWNEVPYLECPAGIDALAAALQPFAPPRFDTRRMLIVPGLRASHASGVADVMRGEETQIAGLLDELGDGTHLVCLPGTHSKWVTVCDGRIADLATAMTGELFALLRKHSILAQSMSGPDDHLDTAAFDAGFERSADRGGLLHHLFGVRTHALFGRHPDAALPSYLSGLLIGHELRGIEALSRNDRPARVELIGNDALLLRYTRALGLLGIASRGHHEQLAAVGMHRLAERAGIARA